MFSFKAVAEDVLKINMRLGLKTCNLCKYLIWCLMSEGFQNNVKIFP